ncbi:MAG: M14 family metallopeptidase [Bacteroidetes bacterium]|nr:M14 family metallopeptidase [Bacteroidota bacterium]
MKKNLLYCFLLLNLNLFAQQNDFTTYFEKSNGMATPRYDATVAYCKKLDLASDWVKYMNFGKSPQGREMPLIILDKKGNFTPEAIHKSGNVVLLIQAAIHAGEPDGKDAVMMLIRDIAINKRMTELLDHITLLFIPIFNVDGHERFSKFNRINQNGPKEMGWRTTANNLNLNRDYLKADALEMKCWLKLFNRFMPDFFIDCHTTDGADYQYVLTYGIETEGNVDEGLQKWQKENYLKPLTQQMTQLGLPMFPYVTFRNWHDPRSGLVSNAAPPMLSQGYTIQRNRPGVLIETHMLKPYKIRVESTYKMIEKTMMLLNKEYLNLHQCIADADKFTASENFRKKAFAVNFEASEKDSSFIDYLGVEYSIEKSELTGGEWFKYDNTKPITFKIPYFNHIEATAKVILPKAYIIAAEWDNVIAILKLHNITLKTINKPLTLKVQTYKFKNLKWSPTANEGRHPLNSFDLDTIELERTYPAGSVIVDMNQAGARIIAYLLEPKASGSLAFWGYFDAVFQQKEYAESYVMETLAREMLAKDATLKKEFEQKKSGDAEFAKNPRAILNWFYSKSPYWDKELNIYPVGKIF